MSTHASSNQRELSELQPGRGAPSASPTSLDRRFEAVILWSAKPSISARAARDLVALCEVGAQVGWLAPAPIGELAERLSPPSPDAASCLLADSKGTGDVFDHVGLRLPSAPISDEHLAALDLAGELFVEVLAGIGLMVSTVPRSAGCPKISIQLVGDPAMQLGRSRAKQFLYSHGITSLTHLSEMAIDAARGAGVHDPRVVIEGTTVEIALVDSGDVALAVLEELWRQGVDPHEVLTVVDGLRGLPHRPAPVLDPDVRTATVVLVNGGRNRGRRGLEALNGGTARLHWLLSDQLRRRRKKALPRAGDQPGWMLRVEGFDAEEERVHEALLTLADGHVGTSGAALASDPSRHPWVVAAGVYHGEGASSHLLTGPVAFEFGDMPVGTLRRVLNMRSGLLSEFAGDQTHYVKSVRFASLAQPTTAVLRVRYPASVRPGHPLMAPADDPVHDRGSVGATQWVRVAASKGGIVAAAVQTPPLSSGEDDKHRIIDRFAVYQSDPNKMPDFAPAVQAVQEAATIGFDRLLSKHREVWARRWEEADVVVEGDDDLQLGIRFALFHLMASVADTGEAAVGARGLTGMGYRGHVFWDTDTFVLPFLAATHPASARAILEYRIRRLPAAMEAARAAQMRGARFPWESARTGHDVTPTSARDRSGRIVPIRTGILEEHIVAQVPWAASCYVEWSGDEDFARGPGRLILTETARYWASRIRVERDGSAHIFGVVGPDEYHEPVDDNAFTNVMARWNLRQAAAAAERYGIVGEVDFDECGHWLELADALIVGYDPDTGIYEQFAGFHDLEPLVIAEVAPRRPIAADLLLGAERTRSAQVIKQADVLMLHHLVPDEVVAGSLEPNMRFYEPRTAHGSSLSPAIHAALLARTRDFDRALSALRTAVRMDLDDLTGSTAQGLHLATMGGVWQALAFGFMGLRPRAGVLHVDPLLPPMWSAIELRVQFRGAHVRLRKDHDFLSVVVDRPIQVAVGGLPFTAGPGELSFGRRGPKWEAIL